MIHPPSHTHSTIVLRQSLVQAIAEHSDQSHELALFGFWDNVLNGNGRAPVERVGDVLQIEKLKVSGWSQFIVRYRPLASASLASNEPSGVFSM